MIVTLVCSIRALLQWWERDAHVTPQAQPWWQQPGAAQSDMQEAGTWRAARQRGAQQRSLLMKVLAAGLLKPCMPPCNALLEPLLATEDLTPESFKAWHASVDWASGSAADELQPLSHALRMMTCAVCCVAAAAQLLIVHDTQAEDLTFADGTRMLCDIVTHLSFKLREALDQAPQADATPPGAAMAAVELLVEHEIVLLMAMLHIWADAVSQQMKASDIVQCRQTELCDMQAGMASLAQAIASECSALQVALQGRAALLAEDVERAILQEHMMPLLQGVNESRSLAAAAKAALETQRSRLVRLEGVCGMLARAAKLAAGP